MKYYFLTILFLVSFADAFAQGDFGGKSFKIAPPKQEQKVEVKSIPISRFPSVDFPSITPPSSSFNKPKPTNSIQIGETTSKINMTPNQDFKSPGLVYEKKLNKKEGEGVNKNFRKNQYIGDYKTKSTFIKTRCRDYGAIDGDRVKIYVNEVLVVPNIFLEYDFKQVELTLKTGINTIDFVAINEGELSPNTAQFDIFDDKGDLICRNTWDLSEGFKATVIIVKE